jgi:glycerol kinase
MHTGTEPVESKSGLLSTIAFKLGPEEATHYALEGSIAICGMAVAWLRDQLGLISSASESETIASAVVDTGTHICTPFTLM